MRALILSCNTGGGHNAAGKALEEALTRRRIDCEMKDTLAFGSPKTSQRVSGTYINITRTAPKLFGTLYRAGSIISNPKLKSPVYLANTFYAEKLRRYILDHQFDTVLCPHLFPAEALTYLRAHKRLPNVRVYGVATDYTCTPFWEETDIDRFFIPSKELRPEYEDKGFAPERLIETGIPVMSRFRQKTDRMQARKALGIPCEGRIYLCMTGSMGFGDVLDIAGNLLTLDKTGHIIVLAGSNDKLISAINERFAGEPRIKAVPFTKDVPLYMDASNVVLSKPGGLSSTEAAVKNVPLVHTSPIPGCETINARFFSTRGMSVKAVTPNECAQAAYRLASDPKAAEAMLLAQRRFINPSAAEAICDFILS